MYTCITNNPILKDQLELKQSFLSFNYMYIGYLFLRYMIIFHFVSSDFVNIPLINIMKISNKLGFKKTTNTIYLSA